MRTLRNRLGPLAIAIAGLALPAAATAAPVVPPENSAATQYTEAIPTGGGRKDAGKEGGGKERTPAEVLGNGKAGKLKAHGPEGQAAAEVAAETAPTVDVVTTTPAPAPEPPPSKPAAARGPDQGDEPQRQADETAVGDAVPVLRTAAADPPLAEESASSGFGEVLGQATGSSGPGQLGPLLPLLILGTILWSLLFAWRQRRHAS